MFGMQPLFLFGQFVRKSNYNPAGKVSELRKHISMWTFGIDKNTVLLEKLSYLAYKLV